MGEWGEGGVGGQGGCYPLGIKGDKVLDGAETAAVNHNG